MTPVKNQFSSPPFSGLSWFSQTTKKWILTRLALQNLGRRKARTLLLMGAIAIVSSALFTTGILMWGIDNSIKVGFSRLGADLLVVPPDTLVNLTSALLTAEPIENTLDTGLQQAISELSGVEQVAPQQIARTTDSGYGHAGETVDLIGFDPQQDFTVMPWLQEKLQRPLTTGDVMVGGRRNAPLNSQIVLYGKALTVYGRLGLTGVGTHERGLFMTFDTLAEVANFAQKSHSPSLMPLAIDRLSALLVKLEPQATFQAVRFAILALAPDTKVVAGNALLTSVRQGLTALLTGILTLMLVMVLGLILMVSVLFSAIISERRHELGLLMAVGSQRFQIIRMIFVESALVTGFGGLGGAVLGGLLLRLYQHSLIYHLHALGVPLAFPSWQAQGLLASGCVLLACAIGVLGAWYPAWQVTRQDADCLMRAEG